MNKEFWYADGLFRGYKYNQTRLAELKDRLQAAEARAAGVSSPRIKSEDEAKYKKSTAPPADRKIDAIMVRDALKNEIVIMSGKVSHIDDFRNTLTAKLNDVFRLRYEELRSIKDIAIITGVTYQYVSKQLETIAERFVSWENKKV